MRILKRRTNILLSAVMPMYFVSPALADVTIAARAQFPTITYAPPGTWDFNSCLGEPAPEVTGTANWMCGLYEPSIGPTLNLTGMMEFSFTGESISRATTYVNNTSFP